MKWLISILVILSMALLWGCSSDDGGGGNDPITGPARIEVTTNTTGYDLSNPQASDWGLVDSVTVEVSMGNPPAKIDPSLVTAVTNEVKVKAAIRNDSLFVLLQWADDSNDIWPNNWTISQITPGLAFDSSLFDFEDQMFVMFYDEVGSGWDVWNWRILTTGAENLAEGMSWKSNALISDENGTASTLVVAIKNKSGGFAQPEFVHQDTSEYNDPVLFVEDAISRNDWVSRGVDDSVHWYQTTGWQIDQKIQGWLIDGSVSERSEEQRGSRWDIGAYSVYSGGVYSLVMTRKLNTTYDDDLNLSTLDSVKVQLGVLNNQASFIVGTSNRGFSEDFWLIF